MRKGYYFEVAILTALLWWLLRRAVGWFLARGHHCIDTFYLVSLHQFPAFCILFLLIFFFLRLIRTFWPPVVCDLWLLLLQLIDVFAHLQRSQTHTLAVRTHTSAGFILARIGDNFAATALLQLNLYSAQSRLLLSN